MIKWEAQEISENKQQSLKMTNFSQNGHSCSASSNLGNDYPAWRPFGYNSTALANQWCSAKGAKEAYLNYSFDSLICVTKMEFCNPLDEGLSTTSNFTLQGAMDNNGPWNDIQTFSNVPDKTVQTLNIQNNNYYKHYRVHFTKPNNNWESGTIRCSWLKYFGTKKIVKKYEVKKVYYGNNPMKKIVVGTNKVIYQRETWKYKTGNLVKMTSANTPLPYSAYGGESQIYFHEPWESYNWDRTGGTWNYFVSPILNTNQKIIPVSINVRSGSNKALGSQMWHFYGSNNGSSWTELGSAQTGNIGGGWGTKEITIHTGLNTNNCQGYQYFKVGPDGHPFGNVQVNNLNIRITEWYIKSK